MIRLEKLVNDIENHVEMDIKFDKGTYEIYLNFKEMPTTYANLFVDTKRHQYFIEKSEGEFSAETGVEYLVSFLRDNFVTKIAKCNDVESLEHRSKLYTIDSLCGPTLRDDRGIMDQIIELFPEYSMSYTERDVIEGRLDDEEAKETIKKYNYIPKHYFIYDNKAIK